MKDVNTDVAYDYVRKRILDGEYQPGRVLMTGVLAREIGVSRTPVRDALRKLENDGLVTIRAHLGAHVKKLELQEYRDLCDLRLGIEVHGAGRAAKNRTESDLHEIRFALESMPLLTERIVNAVDKAPLLSEMARQDVRFHFAIMVSTKNNVLKDELLRLHLINRVLLPAADPEPDVKGEDFAQRRRLILTQHEKIHAGIEAGDESAAKQAMEVHLQDMIGYSVGAMMRAASGAVARDLTPHEFARMTI